MEVDGCDGQNKKKGWIFIAAKQIYQRQKLMVSPAMSNESPMLELSGAWEPSNRTGAWGFNLDTRSFSCVLSRNMAR